VSEQTILTVVVPCYNSADYMDHCVRSLLVGATDVEILIVDDGSGKDETPAKADAWAAQYPDTITVIHQANTGYGGVLSTGLAAARGTYFYVVDSDDWVDRDAFNVLLATLRRLVSAGTAPDLMVVNYVSEHVNAGTRRVSSFGGALPKNRLFTWNGVGRFRPWQMMLLHALVYRTSLLRDAALVVPHHTYYVDNIFSYVPLPLVNTAFYLPVDVYRYFIGRADQSVNPRVMVRRLDQQFRVTTCLIDAVKLPEGAHHPKLARYMRSYLAMIVAITAILALIDGSPAALEGRARMRAQIDAADPTLWRQLGPLAWLTNLPGRWSGPLVRAGYELARRVYRFN